MQDTYDDLSLLPTALDMERLNQLRPDGRVESESGFWVVLQYPPMPGKGPRWCEFSLVVNHPQIVAIAHTLEFKNMTAVLAYLDQLELARKKASK